MFDEIDPFGIERPLRILIGCETSGVMRRAFAARGHDVWSNDVAPAEDGSNRHLRGDIREYLDWGWDMLAVMHPPCTRLCNSGVRWLHERNLWDELREAAALFSACWNAPIPRVAVENPIMHRHAKELIENYQDPAQTVQPWWFGEEAFKATCFYLRGLPPLKPTNKLTPPKPGTAEHKAWSFIHLMPRGPERSRLRSRTFVGIAEAAADQWGSYALEEDRKAA